MSLGDGGHEPDERGRPADDERGIDVDAAFEDELDDPDGADDGGWPMVWHGLAPGARWRWFDRLWSDVCSLSARYRLSVRSEWWADELQVEVLAAFAAWVHRYDTGEWDDPPGKLALLFDLERVAAALRDGIDPFHPERDRPAFERHLRLLGCRPPPNATAR
jgi:hypothetical protein